MAATAATASMDSVASVFFIMIFFVWVSGFEVVVCHVTKKVIELSPMTLFPFGFLQD
jgi:hypothetical protein